MSAPLHVRLMLFAYVQTYICTSWSFIAPFSENSSSMPNLKVNAKVTIEAARM